MARFAPVAPVQVLAGLYEQDYRLFGDYHLLLAHHTVEKEAEFRALFERVEKDNECFPLVIMDNSLVELGGAVDFDMMVKAVDIVKDSAPFAATVIAVLPDVMGDGPGTRKAIEDAYERWANSGDLASDGLMAVIQGATIEDYTKTIDFLVEGEFAEVTWFGVPRVTVKDHGSRIGATQEALRYAHDVRIHLLGFSDNMQDDILCAMTPGVDGIDSAVPLRLSEAWTPELVPEPRPKDWFETAEVTPRMVENLKAARRAVR